MKKIALVTGATAGIGRATAMILAKNDYDVIITGRRKDRLDETEQNIRNNSQADVLALTFDVRKYEDVSKILGGLSGKWARIDLLVNNAGLASGLNKIHEGDLEDWEKMIDTNIKGLLYVTRIIAPAMVERKSGHIINIGSIAGVEVYENGNVYCATKHAVDALNKGMRIDLVEHNIKVTSINPGAAKTEFSLVRFHGDQEKADRVYDGFIPLFEDDIAEAVLFAATRPPHVNINEILIMPTAQANTVKTARK
ncbi:MAG: SDR family NAD(P)-dependent oxidoreductase [Bacteroidales bacterium]|nr:SDR family NAD(P)-dependent oxidoreductase [Bacteroidales bacterium]